MLRKSVTLFVGAMVLVLLVGDHYPIRRSADPDSLFRKYKIKHEAVRADLQAVAEELRNILKTRPKTPAPRIYIALLTELARIKAEIPLLEHWEQGTLDKRESLHLMADSMLILEYLHMMGAFASAVNETMKEEPAGPGRQIASVEDALSRAARRFPEIYSRTRGEVDVLGDPEILATSREAHRLVPIAQALFAGEDGNAVVEYRVRFFSQYANNIIEKNRAKLQAFQKSLKKS